MTALIHNKKVGFNYEIVERFEAGIELLGHEVKSIRAHHGSLDGAYVLIRGGEAFLTNMSLPAYQVENVEGYNPLRIRKLLLTRAEIARLAGLEKGLTIVPILVYNKARKLKVEIATVKGKKKHDKRETLKKRDTDRNIRREFSDR
ncbi:MAG: SsrA-binding protein SmpB [bacterium]|nr:SsrA-binding protein SmpB [bacterium]